jgi:hypothetical protein
LNEASEAVAAPSDTLITMFEYEATSAPVGVPLSVPLDELKLAHAGRLLIENVNGSLSGSLAVGVNEYWPPTSTDSAGLPLIVGLRFAAGGGGGFAGGFGSGAAAASASSSPPQPASATPIRASASKARAERRARFHFAIPNPAVMQSPLDRSRRIATYRWQRVLQARANRVVIVRRFQPVADARRYGGACFTKAFVCAKEL